jgi:serine/threonine-protein kinase SRPK3
MMELTGETFNEMMLSVSGNHDDKYGQYTFHGFLVIIKSINCVMCSGKLLCIDQLLPVPLEKTIMDYGLPEAEVIPAANFLCACLHLNPEERSFTSDLEAHTWLETAYMCC